MIQFNKEDKKGLIMKKYLLLLVLPILMYANVGKITVLKGDVKIQRVDKTIQAKSGSTLEKNDFIKTSKDGKVQIVFTDKTVFTIGKNSTLDIADYLYDESQPKKNKAKFNVLKGAFSSITGRIGKLNKSKFKLRTKSASIGIRGTIIKANQEVIMCTEGAISVTTLNGITVRVDAGQKTNVATGTPTAPEAIKVGDAEKLGTGDDVEQEVKAEEEAKVEAKEEDKEEDKEEEATAEEATAEEAKDETSTSQVSDVQSDVTSESISKDAEKVAADALKDLTLKGKTISTDGTVQDIQIDIRNASGDIALENEEITITDNQGNAATSTADDTVTWGHWVEDTTKKWVAGKVSDVKVLDDMRNNPTQTTEVEYTGQSMGTVNETDNIKINGSNEVKINFELGGGKNIADGSIKFDTESGQSWNTNFEGTTSETTFSSNAVSGHGAGYAIDSDKSAVKGTVYGNEAQSVGGAFNLQTTDDGIIKDKATGVFKATK